MGTISYPHTGMGIVAGIIFFRGYGYGIELPGGYIPVAIPVPESSTIVILRGEIFCTQEFKRDYLEFVS